MSSDSNLGKFQQLLCDLFQFDCADLDFGIYRILNYKRDVIEQFIKQELPETIAKELERGVLANQSQAVNELKEVAQQIKETLGKDTLDADGNLAESYHGIPLGKKYQDLKSKTAGERDRDTLNASIFNYLYTFFSRYYQEGDFISKRRYSRRQKYAIPYNGEEVYLHWANNDQYYVKTAEHFLDYTFTSRNVTVFFKLQIASVDQNNVKGDKRLFLPLTKNTVWDESSGRLTIPFEFRSLNNKEKITYGQRNQQETIIVKALTDIPKRLKKVEKVLAALMAEYYKSSDSQPVSCLEHHLRQYTRRNTSDFFIHKDLKGFLSRELDFFLKNEVLNLDDIEFAGEDQAEGWFQIIQTIKTVGSKIIDFLDQIECFQKMLWEKSKFITDTQYFISICNVNDSFYSEIVTCESQWTEWKHLFHIDEIQTNLFKSGKNKNDKRIAFLKAHPTLMLDTKYFTQDFVDRLLGSFNNLDEMTDGVLIHSENFQAINLISEKYQKMVQCIYIDPPFNTGASAFIYKNEYRHSSWMSMMFQTTKAGAHFLSPDGINVTAIDDYELTQLAFVLDKVFGSTGRIGLLVVENKPSGRTNDMFLATCHEYYFFHSLHPESASINFFPLTEEEKALYVHDDDVSSFKWRDFLRTGGYSTPQERPNSYYPIYLNVKTGELSLQKKKNTLEILPIDSAGHKRVWRKTRPSFLNHLANGEIRYKETQAGKFKVELIDRIKEGTRPKSIWSGSRYDAASHGTKLLKNILGDARQFDFPKSVHAVRDALYCCTSPGNGDIVFDFFAGSGTTRHATINLNREDDGERRFILVEMGDYFDTVLIPRIKKITFTPEWKDGKPKCLATQEEVERSPRIVKHMRLESYEDALNNIEFDYASGQAALKFEDYMLKYMFKWETRASETLLNVEKMTIPFKYKLHIHADSQTSETFADVPETFNYLLGLHVQTRQVHFDEGRRYLVYRGLVGHQQIVVIWRETKDWQKVDLERDKKFITEQKLTEGADEIFVNGDSFITDAKALEPVFKARMFSSMET